MSLEFEIYFEEQRRNTGRGGRESIFRVWVQKLGRQKPWRDQTFSNRRTALEYFGICRRTMNANLEATKP